MLTDSFGLLVRIRRERVGCIDFGQTHGVFINWETGLTLIVSILVGAKEAGDR